MKKSDMIFNVAMCFLSYQFGDTLEKETELTHEQITACAIWLVEELRTAKALEDWEAMEAAREAAGKEAEANG
ncbi:MAG: hypothetical protein LUE89_07435 [Clostridiales bacterium]|nr:hypothetical protein [Clostridiales bacterium]